MDFDFSFEQKMIAESTQGILSGLPPVMDVAPYPYDPAEAVRQLGELGIFGSGEAGEPALAHADAVAAAMEIGRTLPAGPVLEQLAVSLLLEKGGYPNAARLAEGAVATMGISGGLGEHDRKAFAPFADNADLLLIPDQDGASLDWHVWEKDALTLISAECIDIATEGFWVQKKPGAEGTRLAFNGVIQPAHVLQLLALAEMTGCAQFAFDTTVGYIRERKQFGCPIGTYQAVKHHAADAASHLEIMKAAVEYAAWSMDHADEHSEDAVLEALLTARSFVGEHARLVLELSIQMHGGIAFTWDHGIHRYLRRILYRAQTIAKPMESREAIAASLLDR